MPATSPAARLSGQLKSTRTMAIINVIVMGVIGGQERKEIALPLARRPLEVNAGRIRPPIALTISNSVSMAIRRACDAPSASRRISDQWKTPLHPASNTRTRSSGVLRLRVRNSGGANRAPRPSKNPSSTAKTRPASQKAPSRRRFDRRARD